MIPSATLIPIASALLAAIASILARILLKDISAKHILAANFLIMGGTLLILSPFFYSFVLTPQSVLLVLVIAAIDTAANYFYFKTFEKTEASIAIPILSLSPIATFLFSAIFLSEYPPAIKVVTALAIVVLIISLSIDWKNLAAFRQATLWPALASAVLFGASAIPSKYLLSAIEATNAPTLYMLRAGLIGLFAACFFRDSLKQVDFKTCRFIFLRGLFVIGQWVLLYYALTIGSAGVVVTLGNITPIFVLWLSLILLKERFSWKKAAAALAVFVLSLTL